MPLAAALPDLLSTAAAGAGVAGSLISSGNQSKAISSAESAQQQANQAALAEQQREFGINQTNLAPWLGAGPGALSQQLALLGIPQSAITGAQATASQSGAPDWAAYVQNNPDVLQAYNTIGKAQGTSLADFGQWHWNTFGQNEAAQGNPNRTYTPYGPAQAQGASSSTPSSPQDTAALQQQAIDGLKNSPLYTSEYNNGRDTILADAAATGGLRGGNTQNSLARFGGDLLSSVIQNQLQNLGGISGSGQSAAGTLGSLNAGSGSNISTLLNQGGANAAGGILGQANVGNNSINTITNGIGALAGNSSLQQALSSLFGGSGNVGSLNNTGALNELAGLF